MVAATTAARRPNIVVFMMDQLSALALPFHGAAGPAKAPTMARLAAEGAVFENAYCNYPLCAPARFSFMTGRLPSRIGAYDNAAELPASVPTFAHYLRRAGYYTCLSGKMHFIGPDQLHGFEDRLTTDIYPADFGWTPSWQRQRERLSGRQLANEGGVSGIETVTDAGAVARSMQIDYDEEVAYRAIQKIFDLARSPRQPFLLVVSFTQPHDPFVVTRESWDLYDDAGVPPPSIPASHPATTADPHAARLDAIYDFARANADADVIRRARRGYHGMISYVDGKIGQLLAALDAAGFGRDTVTLCCSDHGEMLGERGLWFKKVFYEPAMRVPLVFHGAGIRPARMTDPVSLVDVLPTLVELAGGSQADLVDPVEGRSLVPAMRGGPGESRPVFAEHFDGGITAPRFMVRKGRYKLTESGEFPRQVFDLETDPLELANLASRPAVAAAERELVELYRSTWDAAALAREIEASQRRRRFLIEALAVGRHEPWDYAPPSEAQQRYVRRGALFPDVERNGYLAYPPSSGA